MNKMPGFTAEKSLCSEGYSSIHREALREFDSWNRVEPARSCSSRDGEVDCFCDKGCRRTSTNCSCPNG